MQTSYDILFSVALKHNYFSANKLECLTIVPTQACTHLLNRSNLLFKPFKDGFTILYDALFAGRKRERAQAIDGSLLRFQITLNDAQFYNYTSDFETNPTTGLFYFNNTEDAAHAFLHKDDVVNDTSIRQAKDLKEDFFIKPFGLIDIDLSAGLQKEYVIRFAEKATYWRYHLVSDHLKTLNSPAILRGDELFEGPLTTVLPDKREAITFVSREPIALFEFPKGSNQLVENYEAGGSKHKTIMRALPTPGIRELSKVEGSSKKDKFMYSEIFI